MVAPIVWLIAQWEVCSCALLRSAECLLLLASALTSTMLPFFLPFPLDARLRSSALSPDLQRAVRSSVLAGESLAARRHTAIALITRVASELRRISALVADACMPSSVHHISGHTNV